MGTPNNSRIQFNISFYIGEIQNCIIANKCRDMRSWRIFIDVFPVVSVHLMDARCVVGWAWLGWAGSWQYLGCWVKTQKISGRWRKEDTDLFSCYFLFHPAGQQRTDHGSWLSWCSSLLQQQKLIETIIMQHFLAIIFIFNEFPTDT